MRIRLLVGIFIVSSLVIGGVRYAASSSGHKPHDSGHKPQDSISWSGSITGYVVDPEGQPVHNAKVYADFSAAPMGKRRYVLTDAQGSFLINGLRPGRYAVSAAKEEEGYPPTDVPFYYSSGAESPKIVVDAEQTTSGVVVRMGQKAARLVGQAIDAKAGEPVGNARITLSRADNPEYSYSTSLSLDGEFEVLIPSTPIEIKVSAPDYEDWRYVEDRASTQARPLQLTAGETRKLSISLQRKRIR